VGVLGAPTRAIDNLDSLGADADSSSRSHLTLSKLFGHATSQPPLLPSSAFSLFSLFSLCALTDTRGETTGRSEHKNSATAGCLLALAPAMTEVAPVKAILKALETGIKLAGRVSESAELAFSEAANSATTAKAQQIAQSAPNLQKALEQTCQAIRDAYQQAIEAYGKPFTKALVEDSE
jgi:hypothetical protein